MAAWARKRFGQHFLADGGVVEQMVRAIAPQPGQRILEVGPGRGALTEALLEHPVELRALEIDRDLHALLERRLGGRPNLRLQLGDALRFDYAALPPGARLVGNLPYNIATPLLAMILEGDAPLADLHIMVQREVAQRLCAAPGTRHWGRLAVLAQYAADARLLFAVPPDAFAPPPLVQSAVVRLTLRPPPLPAADPEHLRLVVRTAFAQRRKTLRNSLAPLLPESAIRAAALDPAARPQTITLPQFITLANIRV